ncbi:hypothetical protein SERRSCBI_13685 [Serratia sp. SCBI]|nr:hypothetical protein SERRSCBI_13685 [Serratia sp. SCBI]
MTCAFDIDLIIERNGIDIVLMLRRQINDGVTARQRFLQSLRLSHIAILIKGWKMCTGLLIDDDQCQIIALTETFRQACSDKTGTPDNSYFTLIHNLSLSRFSLFPSPDWDRR